MTRGTGKNLFGLIGYPVAHSLSPVIFNAAFSATGINAVYELFPIPPDRLDEGIEKILDKGVRGLNVTVPHKANVLPLMKDLDESARFTGAVNTIEVARAFRLWFQTDPPPDAMRIAVDRAIGESVAGSREPGTGNHKPPEPAR